MKKLFVISIAILFLYNTVGYLIVFKSFQFGIKQEIKTRIKSKLDNKDLVLIKYPSHPTPEQNKLFNWKEENEFSYNGNFYDVVRQFNVSDTTYYLCINDTKEKELFASLDVQVDQNMASNSLANNLVKLFKLTIDQTYLYSNLTDKLFRISKTTERIFVTACFVQVKTDVDTPPPEIV